MSLSITVESLLCTSEASGLRPSANCKNPSDTLWVPGSVGSAARFAKYWERYYFSWEGAGRSCEEARILRRSSLISQGSDPLAKVVAPSGGDVAPPKRCSAMGGVVIPKRYHISPEGLCPSQSIVSYARGM